MSEPKRYTPDTSFDDAFEGMVVAAEGEWVKAGDVDALLAEVLSLRAALADARQMQITAVQMPDGSPAHGQCTFDGCQYDQIAALRAALAAREEREAQLIKLWTWRGNDWPSSDFKRAADELAAPTSVLKK